jgi:pSer/pThr/pTyr-binding forkhead associated (FHA) protein
MWILTTTEDSPGALTFRLSPGAIRTIGRAPRADFIVDAQLVSRLHCRVTATRADTLELEDLKSTNGTYVNGKKVVRAELKEGDEIGVGRVRLRVAKD